MQTPTEEILEDRSVSMWVASLYLIVLAGPPTFLQGWAFIGAWGRSALGDGFDVMLSLSIGLPIFVAGVVLHECLHALGWKIAGGAPWRSLRLGFQWKTFTPYAHSLVPLRARAYRIGALLPIVALGLFPFGVGFGTGRGELAAFGMIFTLAAGGDLAVVWLMRGVPATAWVRDHASRAGCYVVSELK